MKLPPSRLLLRLTLLLSISTFFLPAASAGLIIVVSGGGHKPKTKHAPGWTAPSGAPAWEYDASDEKPISIDSEAIPSASLQPFLDSHLEKILAPFGSPAFTQSEIVGGIRNAYAKSMLTAPDVRKPAYQTALAVCDALTEAITARQTAVDVLNKSYENRPSEAVQPRGGKRAVQSANRNEAFFYESQKNNWKQNAALLRQRIAVACQRERTAESQAGEWPAPTPAPAAPPAPDAVAAAPEGPDPVIGNWKLEGFSAVTLTADHLITGDQQGTWRYTCTTNAGRNYELHPGSNGWVDYMVLSADGKVLDGKNKKNKHISAWRS